MAHEYVCMDVEQLERRVVSTDTPPSERNNHIRYQSAILQVLSSLVKTLFDSASAMVNNQWEYCLAKFVNIVAGICARINYLILSIKRTSTTIALRQQYKAERLK